MTKLAMVLLSGGLDSATAAAQILRDGAELSALTVHYGQSHAREIEAARRVAAALDIPHRVVEAASFRDLASYSALTQPDQHPWPVDRDPEMMSGDIPVMYVPLRNTYLLTLAAAALESLALEALESRLADPAFDASRVEA